MYYVEFIRKRSDVPWPEFHAWSRWRTSAGWIFIPRMHPFSRSAVLGGWARARRSTSLFGRSRASAVLTNGRMRGDARSESAAAIEGGTLSVADMDGGVYDDIGLEFV